MAKGKRKSRAAILILLLSALLITTASAAIYYQITAQMTIKVGWSPVVFVNGSDTDACGGDTVTSNASVTFSDVPLTIASNITITELVNVTNSETGSHDVNVTVSTHDFGSELKILLLYLVSPTGSETLVVKIDDSGTVVTDKVQVSIPGNEEWAIKLIGCYDTGTGQGQSNSLTLNLEVK